MPKYVRIQDNVVMEEWEKEPILSPSLKETVWLVDDEVQIGYVLENDAFVPPPVVEEVKPLNQRLDELFMNQSAEVRASFYGVKAAVKAALESGDLEAAELIIQITDVPEGLALVKEQMAAEVAKEKAKHA